MNDLQLPSEGQLARLSREFDWRYPHAYRQFIRSPKREVLETLRKGFRDGWFVKSAADIRAFTDAEMTEREIAFFLVKGRREQMAEITSYGSPPGLFFYGFDWRDDLYPDLDEPPVVVFSIHALVAGWRSFRDFIDYTSDRSGWIVGRYGFLVRLLGFPSQQGRS